MKRKMAVFLAFLGLSALSAAPSRAQYNPYARTPNANYRTYTYTSQGGSVQSYALTDGSGGTASSDTPLFDMEAIADHVGTQVANAVGPIIPLVFKIALPIMAIGLVFKLIKTLRKDA